MMLSLVITCSFIISFCYCYNVYENFSIYEVTAFDTIEREKLYKLHAGNDTILFLNGVTNEAAIHMDVIVDSCCTAKLENMLRGNNVEYFQIDKTKTIKNFNDMRQTDTNISQPINITTAFYTWDTLTCYIQNKLKKYPNLKKIVIGQTHYKKDIVVLKFSKNSKEKRYALFLVSGEEGRDWLGPAILFNLIQQLLEENNNLKYLVKHFDLYILPILNIDGYEYTKNGTNKRFWAKNMRYYYTKVVCHRNESSLGIHLSRNWFLAKHTSSQECDPLYFGERPLSEAETDALSQFLDKIALKMLLFINIRGFNRLITFPYAHKTQCANYKVLKDILTAVHEKLENKYNTSVFHGSTQQFFYNFSGNVADWVKYKLNTPLVYTIYMKQHGYILPSATDIQPLTNEVTTILTEIAFMGSSLYDPLFNCQFCCTTDNMLAITMVIISHLY